MPEYDVVVVCAGPAGSMTAKWAAKSGVRVLMIEKRLEIGSPGSCGEAISRSWRDCAGIKLENKSVAGQVKGAKTVAPTGKSY